MPNRLIGQLGPGNQLIKPWDRKCVCGIERELLLGRGPFCLLYVHVTFPILLYLSSYSSLPQPVEVGVRPEAIAPRREEPEVVGEVDRVELVVDELPDVPGQVVVAEEREKKVILGGS